MEGDETIVITPPADNADNSFESTSLTDESVNVTIVTPPPPEDPPAAPDKIDLVLAELSTINARLAKLETVEDEEVDSASGTFTEIDPPPTDEAPPGDDSGESMGGTGKRNASSWF